MRHAPPGARSLSSVSDHSGNQVFGVYVSPCRRETGTPSEAQVREATDQRGGTLLLTAKPVFAESFDILQMVADVIALSLTHIKRANAIYSWPFSTHGRSYGLPPVLNT